MDVGEVFDNRRRWAAVQADALDFLRSLPTDSVSLVFTSPPYTTARTYGVQAARRSAEWVEWLRPIVVEACRVSRGLVFLNVSDSVRKFRYQNGPEWLHADLTRLDGLHAIRPYIWVKSGPDFDDPGNSVPGSGGQHYHRNDYEPIYGYAEPKKLPPVWSDNTAFGHPPKCGPGGPTCHRDKHGKRKPHTKYLTDGTSEVQHYVPPPLSNPGNVIRARVGGGHLGHELAHESEAPMPLAVAERFVCWFCPFDGICLDPFLGSGTTCHAAFLHGRRFIGCDLRPCQIDLTARRMATVTPDMRFPPPARPAVGPTLFDPLDDTPAGGDHSPLSRAGTGQDAENNHGG